MSGEAITTDPPVAHLRPVAVRTVQDVATRPVADAVDVGGTSTSPLATTSRRACTVAPSSRATVKSPRPPVDLDDAPGPDLAAVRT